MTHLALSLDLDDVVNFPNCREINGEFVDQLADAGLATNTLGAEIVRRGNDGVFLRAIIDEIQRSTGIDAETATRDVIAFVTDAERLGLVRIRRSRSTRARLNHFYVTSLSLAGLSWKRSERRRYPPTVRGAAEATTRACRYVIGATAALTPIFFVLFARLPGFANRPFEAAWFSAFPLFILVAVLGGVLTHELGHLVIGRATLATPRWFLAHGGQVRLVHDRAERADARRVAVAGPFAGAGASILFAGALSLLYGHVGALIGAALAVGHMCSLLPWAHDGRLLFQRSPSSREVQR